MYLVRKVGRALSIYEISDLAVDDSKIRRGLYNRCAPQMMPRRSKVWVFGSPGGQRAGIAAIADTVGAACDMVNVYE